MKSKKLISLIVSAGMLAGTIGAATPAMLAHAETMNNVKTYTQEVGTSLPRAVVKVQSTIMNGNQAVGTVNQYEMAIVKSQTNGVAQVVTQNGLVGSINVSNLMMVNSGVNDSLVAMNKDGHVANVTTVLNVRSNATVQSGIVAQLTNQTNFKIIGQQGSWLKINAHGTVGFIFNEFTGEGHTSVGGQVLTGNQMKDTNTISNVSPVANYNNGTATVGNHTSSVAEHRSNRTTTVAHTTVNNGTATAEHHSNANKTTTPVEHHSNANKTTTPVEHHSNDNKTTTPVEHHSNDNKTTTPVEHHSNDNKTTTPVQATYSYMPQLSQEVLAGINQLRTNAGQTALTESPSANNTVVALAKQMAEAGNADHTFNEMGAMSPVGTSSYIVNMFKNSPEHYSELTTKGYEGIGVAVFKNNKTGEYFTAVQFVAPKVNGGTTHSML